MKSKRMLRLMTLSLLLLATNAAAKEGVMFSSISVRDTGQGNVVVSWETAAYSKARVLYDTVSRGAVSEYRWSTNISKENARLHAELISDIPKGVYYVRPVARIGDKEFFTEEIKVILASIPPPLPIISAEATLAEGTIVEMATQENGAEKAVTEEEPIHIASVLEAKDVLPPHNNIVTLDDDGDELTQNTLFVSKKMTGERNGVVGPIFALTQEIWSFLSTSIVMVLFVLGFIAVLVLRRN